MDIFEITGPSELNGEIAISGSKNAALPIIFASLMCTQDVALYNIPDVVDIHTTRQLFDRFEVKTVYDPPCLHVSPQTLKYVEAMYALVKTMRASVLCLGPLLTRYGEATVSFPGGCAIGARPINLHLDALSKMGAEIKVYDGYVHARAKKLHGATIDFPTVTVTGTENIICAATLATGTTVIHNAAREPEVVDLCLFLKAMGADIEGEGTSTITVRGVSALKGGRYSVMSDRIEYMTYAIAAAASRGRLQLKSNFSSYVETWTAPLKQAGVFVDYDAENHVTTVDARQCEIQSVDIKTAPYPGFATDVQAQWMVLMTQANKPARIEETVFENRFLHVAELLRLGAQITIQKPNVAVVSPSKLLGAEVMATDLRASACLVLAGLIAEGVTRVSRIYHLDRGYDHMEKKLTAVGARIERLGS